MKKNTKFFELKLCPFCGSDQISGPKTKLCLDCGAQGPTDLEWNHRYCGGVSKDIWCADIAEELSGTFGFSSSRREWIFEFLKFHVCSLSQEDAV